MVASGGIKVAVSSPTRRARNLAITATKLLALALPHMHLRKAPILVSLLLAACGRIGFDPVFGDSENTGSPDAGFPGENARPDSATRITRNVCLAGCAHTTIQEALDDVSAAPNLGGLPILVEVQDDRVYFENLSIVSFGPRVPFELRAAPGVRPTIAGAGGSGASAIAVSAPEVKVSGFTFVGSSQRAIRVSAPQVTIDHNFFSADFAAWDPDQYLRGAAILLSGAGTDQANIYNNTFYDCQQSLQIIDAPEPGNAVRLRNNIFVQLSEDRPDYEPILWFKPDVAHYALDSDYNLFYYTGAEAIAWQGGPVESLSQWRSLGHDANGIGTSVNPLLAAPDSYDFHLQSVTGRTLGGGTVSDPVHSPAIDSGEAVSSFGDEPVPHGDVINMGGFGGTAEASRSL